MSPLTTVSPLQQAIRQGSAFLTRLGAASTAFSRPHPAHVDNGEETDATYLAIAAPDGATCIANYSKGLPHNIYGEATTAPYQQLLLALQSESFAQLEAITLGGNRKLTNPLAGVALDLEGPDAEAVTIPPAPRIDSPVTSAEMGELYWMALARDIDFTDYPTDTTVIPNAVTSLNTEFTAFQGPAPVTAANIFRGFTRGDQAGPYLSQYLLQDIHYGSFTVTQQQQTVLPGKDYMTTFPAWLAIQNGGPNGPVAGGVTREIRTLRDLAQLVRVDRNYQHYLNACLILLAGDPLATSVPGLSPNGPPDAGNPYRGAVKQDGFGTFGDWHVLSLLAEVATRALKAVWFQKWYVHRRLRPEEFGGRIHVHLNGINPAKKGKGRYGGVIDAEILASSVLPQIKTTFGSMLLPQAFPEGCPTHPAYAQGHATVAGACVTILKAWFDEDGVVPNPVELKPGGGLQPYTGGALKVGDELDKLASNIGLARDAAGVHWRSDYTEGLRLGEEIAIGVLQEQKATSREPNGFTLTRFPGPGAAPGTSGVKITI